MNFPFIAQYYAIINGSLLKIAIEIVALPSYKMVMFHCYGTVYQRVNMIIPYYQHL